MDIKKVIFDGEAVQHTVNNLDDSVITTNFCQVVGDMEQDMLTTASLNYNPLLGASWGYYVNSGDYKLEEEANSIVAYVLVAGVHKKDIKAYTEGMVLSVTTSKPGWNGNVAVEIDLAAYKVEIVEPKVKLSNGVLRIEFPKIDEKVELEIK